MKIDPAIQSGLFVVLFVACNRIYGSLFAVPALALETQDAVFFGEQCVIAASSNVDARMDLRPTLPV